MAGKLDYVRPTTASNAMNSKIIDKPRDIVWNSAVPELGKQFFVINNLDKSSGLINLSYSGDPESFIDCGRVTSYVKNVKGERTYDFPASRAQQAYEVMNSNDLFFIERKMSLEGRVNLVFEETGPNSTRVTANTRYVITRQSMGRHVANNWHFLPHPREIVTQNAQSRTDTISFNSGASASFPSNMAGQAVECISTQHCPVRTLHTVRVGT
jgi:hypothetical protein